MNNLLKTSKALLYVGVAVATLTQASAQKLPAKTKVMADMVLANNYFMKEWPDPGATVTVKGNTRESTLWTRAVYYEGLMAMYKIDPKKEYYDYAVAWGEKHNWNPRDSKVTRNADNQCAAQTYIDLYNIDKKPERIEKMKACVDLMVNSDKSDDWNWIDALQMAMPVFAKFGVLENDKKYFERMYDIYNYTKTVHGGKGLYNTTDHLWYRDKGFVPPYKAANGNGQDCYWSRGNGWVVAAMLRTYEIMPKGAPHREEYLNVYKEMMAALLPLQREDGYWNVSLKDPQDFGGKELSGTALFVYGMAWGINNGVLDKKTYLEPLTKAWNAMSKECLHPDGMLGFVQGTGKEPKDGQPVGYDKVPDFDDYGLGCFLLAGSEVYKLAK